LNNFQLLEKKIMTNVRSKEGKWTYNQSKSGIQLQMENHNCSNTKRLYWIISFLKISFYFICNFLKIVKNRIMKGTKDSLNSDCIMSTGYKVNQVDLLGLGNDK
jgi:hypothetical protein